MRRHFAADALGEFTDDALDLRHEHVHSLPVAAFLEAADSGRDSLQDLFIKENPGGESLHQQLGVPGVPLAEHRNLAA